MACDLEVEVDEMYQNAGKKGVPHPDPEAPPRRRANRVNGHGNFDNDRPPIIGVFGRATGAAALEPIERADTFNCTSFLREKTLSGIRVYTDEWRAYLPLRQMGYDHHTVCHGHPGQREWARDDDGDGIREVHTNRAEGFWTGLRNFLRTFRGVSKHFLELYVAWYETIHNYRLEPWQVLGKVLTLRSVTPTGERGHDGCRAVDRWKRLSCFLRTTTVGPGAAHDAGAVRPIRAPKPAHRPLAQRVERRSGPWEHEPPVLALPGSAEVRPRRGRPAER
jgi:transposase